MIELKAEPRDIVGKKVNKLRRNGQVPAVLYGHGIKPTNLAVDAKELNRVFNQTGETSILSLVLGGKKHNVLIHDMEKDPLGEQILHVDLYEVRMDEKLKAKIPLIFVGESPLVKTEGAVLIKPLQEVEIEALPQDLPKEIEVDVSGLASYQDHIRVKDIKPGNGVKILSEAEDIVASVVPPRSEKEMEELETQPVAEVGEVEVVGEKEKAEKAEEAQAQAEE